MPDLIHEEHLMLLDLNLQYHRNPHSFLFPDAVKKALDTMPMDLWLNCSQVKSIYQALLKNTSFFQRQFSPEIKEAYTKSKLLAFLNNSKQQECDVVFAHENFELIASNQNPSGLAKAFVTLDKAQLLQTNRRAFSKYEQEDIELLRKNDMLTQEYLNITNDNLNFRNVIFGLVALKNNNLLTEANRSKLINFKYSNMASFILTRLNSTTRTISILSGNYNIRYLIGSLLQIIYLILIIILPEISIFTCVIIASFPHIAAYFLLNKNILNIELSLLTQDNFDTVLNLQINQMNLGYAIDALEVITQDDFDLFICYENILLADVHTALWPTVPAKAITKEHLKAIRAICENSDLDIPTRQRNFARYVNQTILQLQLNDAQSTHTASVHKSVSESASRLLERYGAQISEEKLELIYDEIEKEINALPNETLTHKAAKKCIPRLRETGAILFKDPGSQCTTEQLIALTWIALHDDTLRQGDKATAKALFIEGLYEIQREYNISKEGIDNQEKEDTPSCSAGTFNKLVEKAAIIHPDCVIILITKKAAAMKLPKVVKEEARHYLEKLLRSQTKEELTEKIKTQGADAVWPGIEEIVTNRIFDEFGELYPSKIQKEFIEFVEFGKDCGELEKDNLLKLVQAITPISQALNPLRMFSHTEEMNQGNIRHETANLGMGPA